MYGSLLIVLVILILSGTFIIWLFGERWHLLLPSTRKFFQESGFWRFLKLSSVHGYIYGRWTNQYVKTIFNLPAFSIRPLKWFSDHYHGKVLTQDQAKAIITLNKSIPLRDLEQVIPYPIARDLVLNGPPDVVVYECCCRNASDNPCKPTQVCMVIGQPFADFVLEHNPQSSRKLTQTEALELLDAEHKRGHLHSAWFKDAMMGRFYAICNCCSCCCGGIQTMKKFGVPMLASSGYVATVDEDRCTACGTCEEACIFDAITVNEKAEINWDTCMGCGVCTGQCPVEAVTLVRDEKKGIPLDVRLMVS